MRAWRLVLAVAAWEFRRFYKLRDQLLSVLLAILGGAVGFGVQFVVGKSTGPVRVAVLHAERLPDVILPPNTKLKLEPHDPAEELALHDAVGQRELDGLLVIDSLDGARLLVAREPVWYAELLTALS